MSKFIRVMKRKRNLQAKVNMAFAGFNLDRAGHPAGDDNERMTVKSVTPYEDGKKERRRI
jgi:hypothetical protein